MAESTKRIPHDPKKSAPVRPDDEDPGTPADRPAGENPDADIAASEREAGTGSYVSREKAGPDEERRRREADRRAAEDLGRDADADAAQDDREDA